MRSVMMTMGLGLSGVALAAPSGRLTPTTVPEDRAAMLELQLDGTAGRPALEVPEGLSVVPRGERQEVSITNGRISRSTTYTWAVQADRTGTWDLGPWEIDGAAVGPFSLTVVPRGAGASSGGVSATPAPAPDRLDDRAFVRVWTEEDALTVGQGVPMSVTVYLREDTGGAVAPVQVDAGDLRVSGLQEEPVRGTEEVGGHRFTTFSWTGRLSGVRAGEHTLEVSVPVELEWMELSREGDGRSLLDEMFGDDDPFASMMDPSMRRMLSEMGTGLARPVRRQATVDLERSARVEVRGVPTEGRPDDFRGTVGDFALASEISEGPYRVGEPLTLRWQVTGTGDFDTVRMDGLDELDGWRTYTPSHTFERAVRSGTRGVKRFEQALVPEIGGEHTVPSLSLSFYDPDAGTFRTVHTDPIEIRVEGEDVAIAAAAEAEVPLEAWATPRATVGTQRAVVPWSARPAAIAGHLGVLGLLAGGALFAVRPRDEQRLRARQRRRRIRAAHAELRRAVQRGDRADAIRLARQTLALHLADGNPDALTAAEAGAACPRPEDAAEVRAVFELHERMTYAHDLPDVDLPALAQTVRRILEEES